MHRKTSSTQKVLNVMLALALASLFVYLGLKSTDAAVMDSTDTTSNGVALTSNVLGRFSLPAGGVRIYSWQATGDNSVISFTGDPSTLPEELQISTEGNVITLTFNAESEGIFTAPVVFVATKPHPFPSWTGDSLSRKIVGEIQWHVYGEADAPFILGSGDVLIPITDTP